MTHELDPELWSGLECTVNRVRNTWLDQLERAGHYQNCGPAAFAPIAGLGLRTLRYGLHWERAARAGSLELFAAPLAAMQDFGLEPIAGLVHHGSGPAGTDLLDPQFPEKLAHYARSVAERFPHLRRYTPVNEPQTTARFSALYAHWYPHQRSFAAYLRALVHQMKGTVLSMRAIRAVRPDAQLIATEDGGKTWSTPALADLCLQREHRRWLGVDLLCGRVDRAHPLFPFLLAHGLCEREILWFADNPCPPDILGLNYYLTSDRFLDHRLWNYPEWLGGGDTGDEPLVDIEAVRLRRDGIAGAEQILTEAWNRYGIPVAITECHLGGGHPGDPVRWLAEVWNGARAAQAKGVRVAAVTAWSLLGSFDWNRLVTCDRGDYEPGVFDIRSGYPVPTPTAAAVRQLMQTGELHPEGYGWWRQPGRFTFSPASEHECEDQPTLLPVGHLVQGSAHS